LEARPTSPVAGGEEGADLGGDFAMGFARVDDIAGFDDAGRQDGGPTIVAVVGCCA